MHKEKEKDDAIVTSFKRKKEGKKEKQKIDTCRV